MIVELYDLEIDTEWSSEDLMNYLSMKLARNEFDGVVWSIPSFRAFTGRVCISGGWESIITFEKNKILKIEEAEETFAKSSIKTPLLESFILTPKKILWEAEIEATKIP